MKVQRGLAWQAFEQKWCAQCGKVVEMEPIRTGLPGIAAQKCVECGMGWQANFLEQEEDMLECPDHFTFPSETTPCAS